MSKNIVNKCENMLRLGMYKKAYNILLSYSTVNKDPKALSLLACSAIFLKKYDVAENQVQKVMRSSPKCVEALLAKAYLSINAGHRENALREYFNILDIEPNNALAKRNIERIKFMTNNVRSSEIRPRDFLINKMFYLPSNILISIVATLVLSFGLYFSISYFYPTIKYRLLSKEQRELREKLESIYLFEGLEKGDIPTSAESKTYSPREIANMFEKAKKSIRTVNVNSAVVIINSALRSDINEYLKERFRVLKSFIIAPDYNIFRDNVEYLTVVNDIGLYQGSFVKWVAEVSSVENGVMINNEKKNIARIFVYNNERTKIVGLTDLIVNDTVILNSKNLIEVYGQVIDYNNKEKVIVLKAQLIKHIPRQ